MAYNGFSCLKYNKICPLGEMEIRSGEMPLEMRNVSLHKEPGLAGPSPRGPSGNPVSSQPDCLQPQQHSLGSCFWGNCLLRFYGWTKTGLYKQTCRKEQIVNTNGFHNHYHF